LADDHADLAFSADETFSVGNYNDSRGLQTVDGTGLDHPTSAPRPLPVGELMTSHNPEPESRNAHDHDHYHVLGATVSITADAETTDGEYLVLDMLVPPGFENGLHTHEQSEVFHVVEGEARLHVDGRDEILRPGASGYVPGGERHGFANESDDVCRVVAVMTPGGAEGFFRAVGQRTETRSLPDPVEPTEETLQSVFATGAQYGFEFLGPLPERVD
jgi:quercetin dioxygenase-like cupin family protein